MKKCSRVKSGSSKAKVILTALIIFVFALSFTSSAYAYKTYVDVNVMTSGEPSHNSLLDAVYGLGNLLRIDDGPLPGGDQVWEAIDNQKPVSGWDVWEQAGYSQRFGYVDHPSNTGPNNVLFNTADDPPKYVGTHNSFSFMPTSPNGFQFTLKPSRAAQKYSLESNNPIPPTDHMVTYKIIGIKPGGNPDWIGDYVVDWEDLNRGHPLSDKDFQDLGVHVVNAQPYGTGVVPEIPAGAIAPVIGLMTFGAWFIRRKTAHKK